MPTVNLEGRFEKLLRDFYANALPEDPHLVGLFSMHCRIALMSKPVRAAYLHMSVQRGSSGLG